MRADRLISLVLLLRQRGQMTAEALASELEVSTRTVLRDIEALSASGVPVYVERGRHGGFALLPGFRTELTGLNQEEALALTTAANGRSDSLFGLNSALASGMRKVMDAIPEVSRTSVDDAAQRLLIEPETDLLSRRLVTENLAKTVLGTVRSAVLAGHKLRIYYSPSEGTPGWRIIDPIGLVTVRDRTYLLATREGADRTYRVSRMLAAEELREQAERLPNVDLDQLWQERSARFLSEDHLPVEVRVKETRREELLDATRSLRAETKEADGWSRLDVTFEDLRHAVWALWQLGADVEAISPPSVRTALRDRAMKLVSRYKRRGTH